MRRHFKQIDAVYSQIKEHEYEIYLYVSDALLYPDSKISKIWLLFVFFEKTIVIDIAYLLRQYRIQQQQTLYLKSSTNVLSALLSISIYSAQSMVYTCFNLVATV